MCPADSSLGGVEDSYNAVFLEGDFVEKVTMTGRGAGRRPTASAVVADIIDLAKGLNEPMFGITTDKLEKPVWADEKDIEGRYYVRSELAGEFSNVVQACTKVDGTACTMTKNIKKTEITAICKALDSPNARRVELL